MTANRVACVVVMVVLAAPVHGQDQKPPVFKSGVELIAIDAHVTGRDGQPVAGLGPDQFDVSIDGKVRRVVSAEYLAASAAPAAGAPADELPLEASFSSNEEAATENQGRLVVLIVDQGSFGGPANRAVTAAARRFLDRLGPGDKVALATFPGPGPRVGFTTNRALIDAALTRINGLQEPWPVTNPAYSMSEAVGIARGDRQTIGRVAERECNSGGVLSLEQCQRDIMAQVPIAMATMRRRVSTATFGLQRIVDALAGIDGPKTAVLLSAGLISGERVGDLDTDNELRAVARSAAAARVNLFVLHLDNAFVQGFSVDSRLPETTAFEDGYLVAAGLETLAGLTGGAYQKVVAGADAAFERITREISGAYLLGVEPQAGDRDGKPHRIQVRVRVPNVSVRSRTEFILPSTPDRSRTDEQRLAEAVTSQRMATDLPLRLSHVTLRDASDRLRVVISVAIGRRVTAPAPVKFGYVLYDASGRAAGLAIEQRTLTPVGPGEDAALSFMDAIAVPPGDYTLKFAAMDGQGRLGSVIHNIDARVIAGDGVSTSDLLLVDPSRRAESGVLLPIADGRVLGLSLGTLVEVYADGRAAAPAVTLDVSDRPNGKPLVTTRLPTAVKETGRRWSAEGVLDLSLLPPGTYVASATVADGERRLASVSRPFRLEPRAGATAVGVSVGPRAAFAASATGQFVRRFNRQDALSSDALGFFLGRLQAADTSASAGPAAAASAAIKDGKFDDAMAALRDAGSDELAATFLRGLALFASGELEPAANQFRATLRRSNEFMPAVFYLGACYAAGGRDREAVGAWQTSLITESDARIVFDVLADALLRLQDGEQAIAILTEARDRWPDDDLFLPRLAAAQALQKQRAEAVKTIGPYLDRHPEDINAIFMTLRVLYEAHVAGRAAVSAAEDRQLAAKYAGLYRTAGGPDQALLDKWVAFIGRSGAK